jgi:tetratricopeptide (TPR) repeat protein
MASLRVDRKINIDISCPDVEARATLPTDWLTAPEAALHLGISPELLFFYTSRNFQKEPKVNRRLPTHESEGSTRFLAAELDAFDRYLWEPWAAVGDARRDLPTKVLAYLHAESGGCCMRCGSGVAVQSAHIDPWANSRCNHHHNLLRICSACHNEHDSHHSLPTEELKKLKSFGIERLRGNLRSRLNLQSCFPLPSPYPLFVGRAEELQRLRESLRTNRYLLVHGPGGIGKTQLVLRALEAADTGRPVLWIEAEQYDGVDALRAALEVSLRNVKQRGDGTLESVLDKLNACVVIDGLEQLKASDIEAIDDWITHLQNRLTDTQIIVTSQADLAQAQIDVYVRLAGIAIDAGAQILAHYLRPNTPADASSVAELIAFADGHPLTLRLEAMLINYFGSSTITLNQIRRRGADLLEIQKRSSQTRRTSLRTCLSLAYDTLLDDERKLLYVVANAPAGLFSQMLEDNQEWVNDGRSAIAAVWKWGLIEGTDRGEPRERVRMLSPIASYAIARWSQERPDDAKRLTMDLAENFAVMAAVISIHSEKNGGLPNMVARFEEELPNLLRVLDLAEKHLDNSRLGLMAAGTCAELMRYFFIIHLGHIGSQVMLRGARLALRDGMMKSASNLLAMTVGLAQRSQQRIDVAAAMALTDEIAQKSVDQVTLGNVALCRAIIGSLRDDNDIVRRQALKAIEYFKEALAFESKSSEEHAGLDDIENNLSSSYGLLGGALLAQRDFAEAANAYRNSLELVRGQSVAVNVGQLKHQLGNCEAYLGNLEKAALCYTEAAKQFYAIGMRGYLGNALSEFGHLLLEFTPNSDWPSLPSNEIIEAGIDDVARTIEGCFGQYPFDIVACSTALRNLFGMIVLTSFRKAESMLAFPKTLKTELVPWAKDAVYATENIAMDELSGDAVHELNALLNLEAAIAKFEGVARHTKFGPVGIAALTTACKRLGFFGGHPQRGKKWLHVYIKRRWGQTRDAFNDFTE